MKTAAGGSNGLSIPEKNPKNEDFWKCIALILQIDLGLFHISRQQLPEKWANDCMGITNDARKDSSK